jgi:hypothetical protein
LFAYKKKITFEGQRMSKAKKKRNFSRKLQHCNTEQHPPLGLWNVNVLPPDAHSHKYWTDPHAKPPFKSSRSTPDSETSLIGNGENGSGRPEAEGKKKKGTRHGMTDSFHVTGGSWDAYFEV